MPPDDVSNQNPVMLALSDEIRELKNLANFPPNDSEFKLLATKRIQFLIDLKQTYDQGPIRSSKPSPAERLF